MTTTYTVYILHLITSVSLFYYELQAIRRSVVINGHGYKGFGTPWTIYRRYRVLFINGRLMTTGYMVLYGD